MFLVPLHKPTIKVVQYEHAMSVNCIVNHKISLPLPTFGVHCLWFSNNCSNNTIANTIDISKNRLANYHKSYQRRSSDIIQVMAVIQ